MRDATAQHHVATNVTPMLQERVTSGADADVGEGPSGFLHRIEGYVSAIFGYYEDLGEHLAQRGSGRLVR